MSWIVWEKIVHHFRAKPVKGERRHLINRTRPPAFALTCASSAARTRRSRRDAEGGGDGSLRRFWGARGHPQRPRAAALPPVHAVGALLLPGCGRLRRRGRHAQAEEAGSGRMRHSPHSPHSPRSPRPGSKAMPILVSLSGVGVEPQAQASAGSPGRGLRLHELWKILQGSNSSWERRMPTR